MKTTRLIFSGMLIMLSWSATAQSDQYSKARILYLSLKNDSGEPVPSFQIHLTDQTTQLAISVVSGQKGLIEVPVEVGHGYFLKDDDGNLLDEINIAPAPTAVLTKTILVSKPVSLKEHPYDTVFQNFGASFFKVGALEARITTRITDLDHKPQQNLPVMLVCPKYRKVYASRTNNSGVARFQVILHGDYHLGIGESKDLKTYQIPALSGYSLTVDILYLPTEITERTSNDTVYQESVKKKRATSLRAFLEVTVQNYEHRPLPGESVFLNTVGKSSVFTSKTDSQGKACFLLPYGADYTLHLTYERDIFLCKYPYKEGVLLEDEAFITYRGTEEIKNFFKGAMRDKNGFITEFMSVGVKKIGFDQSNVQVTEHGYHVNFPAKSETPTPAILNNTDVIQGKEFLSGSSIFQNVPACRKMSFPPCLRS
jgi:hypothetical protein